MGKSVVKSGDKPPSRLRYLRGFIGFLLILALFLIFGSFYIRTLVIRKLKAQTLISSSVILTRELALKPGLEYSRLHLLSRLDRLSYQAVLHTPERPGEYQQAKNGLALFLREVKLPSGLVQEEMLVAITVDANGLIEEIRDLKFNRTTSLLWLEPELLSVLGTESSRATIPKRLDQFSPLLLGAVIAIEDERFPSHFGVDVVAISRAFLTNLKEQRVVQGGSTITQQLAKNLFLSKRRTLSRKLLEMFAAILLETAYSKREILEFYMNQIFLGQEGNVAIHGFGEAALSFFGKEAADLTLAEAATLAGIIQAPSLYSPRRYPERAKKRRNIVLDKMLELKLITSTDHQREIKAKISVTPSLRTRRTAPYFADYVRREVTSVLESTEDSDGAIRIHTTLDREHQDCAELAVSGGLEKLENTFSRLRRKKSPLQSALIAIDPIDGSIRAWVGGRDYGQNQFSRVSDAFRQPGSAFKPFVYLTAFDRNLNSYRVARPTSTLLDQPIQISIPGSGVWEPKNYDESYRGEVTVRQALTFSLNIPTVELARKVGIPAISRTASLFGFGENLPEVPALALGAGEVSPLLLARAYAAIANGGYLINLHPFQSIVNDSSSKPLFRSVHEEHHVSSEDAVYVLTTILQDVINLGTGKIVRQLGFTLPAAGKTGTSNDTRDSWFVGFTPRLLAVVWVGFDDNKKLGLTGAQAAAPIWTEYMKCASKLEPEYDFVPPPGVVFRDVDVKTGLLATAECPHNQLLREVFVAGTEPISPCSDHRGFFSREDRTPQSIQKREGKSRSKRPKRKSLLESIWDDIFG